MLEKVIAIQNVGVLKAGTPAAVELAKVSLVYADNARGKSTLSSILGASGAGDAKALAQRRTFGSTAAQRVALRFAGTPAGFNAEFDGVSWTAVRPVVAVFNQDFVERNVYASEGVKPEQREALLEFALGGAAVAERDAFEKHTAEQRDKAAEVSSAERALQGYRASFTVDAFLALEPLPDVVAKIDALDKQLVEAKNVAVIKARPLYRTIPVPVFDLDELVEISGSSFESLNAEAELTVRRHFAAHAGDRTEKWVTEGLDQGIEPECPFCGQATEGLDLIEAYRRYFDVAYRAHVARVESFPQLVERLLPAELISDWDKALHFNSGSMTSWETTLPSETIPVFNMVHAYSSISRVHGLLRSLAKEKLEKPLVRIEPTAFEEVRVALAELVASAEQFNAEIEKLNGKIEEYRAKLEQLDAEVLQQQRAKLVAQRSRFDAEVVLLVAGLQKARAEQKAAEAARSAAKARLDAEMEKTLGRFKTDINAWLAKFGAPFSVSEMNQTYKGGGVRSEYVLNVRGALVKVGPSADGDLSFRVALSEGDKRTLAFAFFLAQLLAAPQRANTTVVLDDVFTSLDRHRRHQTAEAVVRVASECAQVIALGHDAHFLKEVKKRATKKKVGAHVELALLRDAEEYSYLGAFDLDEYCSSDYYKHYTTVENFVGGANASGALEVAKALRPLVEGHLHRCFPRRFKDGTTVGEMLDQVRNAVAPNPLHRLQPHLGDLVDFNEFAAAFHHDTAGSDTRGEVNVAELLPYAKNALSFIQTRKFNAQ